MTPIHDDRGATAVEYALLVFFVSVAMFAGLAAVNAALGSTFSTVADQVSAEGSEVEVPESTPTPTPTPTPTATGGSGDEASDAATEPGDPQSVDGSSTAAGELRVTWSPPADDGGSAILGYDVGVDDRSGKSSCASSFKESDSQTVPTTSATLTGLSGSDYCVRVRAINAEGNSNWVEAGVFSILELTEPGAPSDVTGSSSAPGELVVTWSAPASDGGSAILAYDVELDDRSGQDSCSSRFDDSDNATAKLTSATFTGLTGSAYCVRVRATNDEGDGDWAVAGVVTMAAEVPGVPRDLDKTRVKKDSITLQWDEPSRDGGSSITDYVVQYRESGMSTWITFDDEVQTTSTKVTGLKKDTEYDFRVAAVNRVGQGDYTDIVTLATDD